MKFTFNLFFVLILTTSSVIVIAQQNSTTTNNTPLPKASESTTNLPPASASTTTAVLPKGFNGFDIGLSREQIVTLLESSKLFKYNIREIPSLSKSESRILSVRGNDFIDYGYFLFSDKNQLISLSLFLDPTYLDYATFYKLFEAKYGRPVLSPVQAVWTDAEISLTLERPLHIKYLSLTTDKQATPQSGIEQLMLKSRQQFIDLF